MSDIVRFVPAFAVWERRAESTQAGPTLTMCSDCAQKQLPEGEELPMYPFLTVAQYPEGRKVVIERVPVWKFDQGVKCEGGCDRWANM